jgi:hypothetical protein
MRMHRSLKQARLPTSGFLGRLFLGAAATNRTPRFAGFHGPGRTRTRDLRIMSYASGGEPCSAETVFRAWTCPNVL